MVLVTTNRCRGREPDDREGGLRSFNPGGLENGAALEEAQFARMVAPSRSEPRGAR